MRYQHRIWLAVLLHISSTENDHLKFLWLWRKFKGAQLLRYWKLELPTKSNNIEAVPWSKPICIIEVIRIYFHLKPDYIYIRLTLQFTACGNAGTIYTMSTLSTSSIEEVAKAAPNTNKWFQLYIYKDRQLTSNMVRRAEANGFKAIVLTIDAPLFGIRRADVRNKFKVSHLFYPLTITSLCYLRYLYKA